MRLSTLFGGAALGVIALGLAPSVQAQETTTTWAGAPRFTNDSLTFKVRGRVYLDYVFQEVDGDSVAGLGVIDGEASNSRTRTSRLGVEGTWNANWAYKAEATISSTGGTTQWEDLILEYKPSDTTSLMVGNFKTVGLENITSSRYNTFMERGPFTDVTDIGRVLSIAAKVNGTNWTAMAALSGDSINESDVVNGEETSAIQGRVTFAPVDTDTTKLHLGGWARYRNNGDERASTAVTGGTGALRYRVRPNTNFGNRYIDTGAIADTDTMIAGEFALVHNSLSAQAEYAHIDANRPVGDSKTFDAFYVAGSWFITGEMRRYEANRGEFNRTRILNPTTSGGYGAFEVAARYDYVDLSDAQTTPLTPIQAGEYSAITLGGNWYPFPYVRFQANYTASENDNPDNRFDADVNTFQMRAQFDF